jgi:hypothetical protein
MEPESSLPCSQELYSSPYPEPDQSSPFYPHRISLRSIVIFYHLHQDLPNGPFTYGFPTKTLYALLSSPMRTVGCSFAGLLDVQNILTADAGISWQTEGHLFGDHLITESVRVTPSSVIEVSLVLCSVSL